MALPSLRGYQSEGNHGIQTGLAIKEKCLLQMWCGTGKTRTYMYRILHDRLPLTIVVFPSLILVEQFGKDYLYSKEWEPFMRGFLTLNVSSEGTTSPDDVGRFMRASGPKIIAVTYQSFALVSGLDADLMVFDEAHHVVEDRVRDLIFGIEAPACKMLFFTATPTNKNGVRMIGEEADCGPCVFKFTYSDAVKEGVCNAFQVVPFAVSSNKDDRIQETLRQLLLEIEATGHGRVLTFHGLAEAESESRTDVLRFVDAAQKYFQDQDQKNVTVRGITGSMPKQERAQIMKEFEECPDDGVYILASCNTMGEGVDTKKANKCVFFDPKTSHKAVAQAIGRVTRPQEGGMSEVHVIMEMDLAELEQEEDLEDARIREALGKNMDVTLNVFTWLKEEDPDLAELCLYYPNRFAPHELRENLERQGCQVDDTSQTLEEAAAGGAIEIYTTSMETPIQIIGEGEVVMRLVEGEEDGEYHQVVTGTKSRPTPPRRKPLFRAPRGSDDFSVSWKMVLDDMGRSLLESEIDRGLTSKEKAKLLKEYVTREGKVPPQRHVGRKDGEDIPVKLGRFWDSIKRGNRHRNVLADLLTNKVLKEDYDKRMNKRAGALTPDEKAELLKEYVKREGKVPPSKHVEIYRKDGADIPVKLGDFWSNTKLERQNQNLLADLITNEVLKEDYDNTMVKRALTSEEKAELLKEYVKREGKVPPSKHVEIYRKDGADIPVNLGQLWTTIKCCGKCHQNLLSDLLTNEVFKEDYENTMSKRRVLSEKKTELLKEYVKREGKVPPHKHVEIYRKDGADIPVKLHQFWSSIKNGRCRQKLLSDLLANEVLKEDYEKTMSKRALCTDMEVDEEEQNPRPPKSPRLAPPPSHEERLQSHREGGPQEYPEEARATHEDKIWCNRRFAEEAIKSSGLVVFLESPAMFTTKLLGEPPYNLPKDRMRCPQVDQEAFEKMREHAHVSHEKLHDFLLGCSAGSIGALWMDYCCTFDGNASINPREDIRLVLENRLLRPGGVLFITVSLRAYDSAAKIDLGMDLSTMFREASMLVSVLVSKTYENMYFAGFRFP